MFGSQLDDQRYQETLWGSSLLEGLELFPNGDLTEIGEKGPNLSGSQKQQIQLVCALYQNAATEYVQVCPHLYIIVR